MLANWDDSIYCPLVSEIKNLEQPCWVVLAQGLSWGYSLTVSLGCPHPSPNKGCTHSHGFWQEASVSCHRGFPMCCLSILPTQHLSLLRAVNSNRAENEGERETLGWKSMFLYNLTISEAVYQHFCYIRFVRRVLLSPMDS